MKRIIALGLSSLFALPIILTSVALAQEGGTPPPNKPTAEELKALTDRVQKRKTELKTRLSAGEKQRLLGKCKASQGLISSVSGRVKGIETSRSKVYTNLVNRLTDLSTKLQNRGADTTELDASIDQLKTLIETFTTDLATYKQPLEDLVKGDCQADLEGFKASLESARATQTKVGEDGKAIRSHLSDVIKPLLKTIREQLEAQAEAPAGEGE